MIQNLPHIKTTCSALLLLVIILSSQFAFSQVPQYMKKKAPNVLSYFCHMNPAQDTTPPRKVQMIYQPSKHFSTAPRGNIKAIYFRSGSYINNPKFNSPGFVYNFQVSMGWTTKDTFRKLGQAFPSLRDTFLTGVTPVYNASVVRQNIKDSGVRWMKFTLPNSFLYAPEQGQNLLVEITFGPPFVNNYFCLYDSLGGGAQQQLVGYTDTPSVYSTFRDPITGTRASVDFGFDLTPVGVEAGVFEGSFLLYPNPSKGSFKVNIDAQKNLEIVSLSARSITGQIVYQQTYKPNSINFITDIHLPKNIPTGMYLVEMNADGERIIQRVLIE